MNAQIAKNAPEQMHLHTVMGNEVSRSMQISGLFLTLTCVALLIWSTYLLSSPETLPIKQVRIEGEFTRLSPGMLKTMVTDKVRGGFFNLNVDAVRNVLLANPWVREVTVKRIWPDGLLVSVLEQAAVVRWGKEGLLNSAGEYFSPESETFPEGLPVLFGPHGTEVLLLNRFNETQKSIQDIGMNIKNLTLNERRAWRFELDSGIQVILGRKDFDIRMERFLDLVPLGLTGKLSATELVDMRYTNGFAVRWKQDDSVTNVGVGLKKNGKKT
ncbi:MAG: cell division protein FtsQ/DivIB [Gammaproteobacteria bacterium]